MNAVSSEAKATSTEIIPYMEFLQKALDVVDKRAVIPRDVGDYWNQRVIQVSGPRQTGMTTAIVEVCRDGDWVVTSNLFTKKTLVTDKLNRLRPEKDIRIMTARDLTEWMRLSDEVGDGTYPGMILGVAVNEPRIFFDIASYSFDSVDKRKAICKAIHRIMPKSVTVFVG